MVIVERNQPSQSIHLVPERKIEIKHTLDEGNRKYLRGEIKY